jgi:shikimate kinase
VTSDRALLEEVLPLVWEIVDPRLREEMAASLARRLRERQGGAPWGASATIVLGGQRTAGKSRLLAPVARLVGRAGHDLDHVVERVAGRPLREWFNADPEAFRRAERTQFATLERPCVVAVGGGFLTLHGDLLAGCTTVLVPVSFATYRERLLADTTRPRLRPELSVEEEIATVYREREAAQARLDVVPLVDFLAWEAASWRAR